MDFVTVVKITLSKEIYIYAALFTINMHSISTAVHQSVISDQFQIVNQNLFPDMNRAN